MPTTMRTGTNIKQSFKKSKLNDPEWKDAWVAKFAYRYVARRFELGIHVDLLFSLDLLRLLFDSELLDQPALLTWLTTTSSISEGMAPHQLIFLVQLAHEYFDILVSNRAFATPMIENCAIRYADVSLSCASSLFFPSFTSTHIDTLE